MTTKAEFQEVVDFHCTGGMFGQGFDVLGYIGNSDRNYVTDVWVIAGATKLGWATPELSEWMCSKWGRWALDAMPMSAAAMLDEMRKCDMAGLLAEALS